MNSFSVVSLSRVELHRDFAFAYSLKCETRMSFERNGIEIGSHHQSSDLKCIDLVRWSCRSDNSPHDTSHSTTPNYLWCVSKAIEDLETL